VGRTGGAVVTAEECYNEYKFWIAHYAETRKEWAEDLAWHWLDTYWAKVQEEVL
jgi:hypothetical protein